MTGLGLCKCEWASAPDLERCTFGGKFDGAVEAGLGELDRPRPIAGRRQMGQHQHSHARPGGDLGRLPRCDVKRRVLGQRSRLAEEQVRAVSKTMKRFAGSAISRVGEGSTLRADTQAVGFEAMLDGDRFDNDVAARNLKAVPELVGCEDGLLVLETPAHRRAHRGAPTGRAEDGQRRRPVSGAERQGMDGQRKVGPVIGVKVRDPGGLEIGERTMAEEPCKGPASGVEPEILPTRLEKISGAGQPWARVAARTAKDRKSHAAMMPNRLGNDIPAVLLLP